MLNNIYIQFEECNIGYVCVQYIRFEKYGTSTGMNGDGRTLVHERLWIDEYAWTSVDGRGQMDGTRWMDVDKCWMEADGRWTKMWRMATDCDKWQMLMDGDGNRWWLQQWRMAIMRMMDGDCDGNDDGRWPRHWWTVTENDYDDNGDWDNDGWWLWWRTTAMVTMMALDNNYDGDDCDDDGTGLRLQQGQWQWQ